MRDQYAGDINDFIKYSLLRSLAGDDRKLGIGWYYNPGHDGRNNGEHTEYLSDKNWSQLDLCTWKALQTFVNTPRSITTVEGLPIWPKETCFHRTPIPNAWSRSIWANEMARSLDGCGLVFLDPDNGIGQTEKHASHEEIKLLRMPGSRSLLVIKFPERIPYDKQVKNYHSKLKEHAGADNASTLRISIMLRSKNGHSVPTSRWFTLIDHDNDLAGRFCSFAQKLNNMTFCGIKADIYSVL